MLSDAELRLGAVAATASNVLKQWLFFKKSRVWKNNAPCFPTLVVSLEG